MEKSSSYKLKVDSSKLGNTENHTGLSNESSLHEMLGYSGFDAIDTLSLFLGAIVDSMCGVYHTTEVTEDLTEYVDLGNFLFTRHFNVEWTIEALQHLRSRIMSFKKKSRFASGRYQDLGIRTQKRHAL